MMRRLHRLFCLAWYAIGYEKARAGGASRARTFTRRGRSGWCTGVPYRVSNACRNEYRNHSYTPSNGRAGETPAKLGLTLN